MQTSWEPKGRKGQTRKYYSYLPLDPSFKTTQPVEEDSQDFEEPDGFQEVKVKDVVWEETEGKDEELNSTVKSD